MKACTNFVAAMRLTNLLGLYAPDPCQRHGFLDFDQKSKTDVLKFRAEPSGVVVTAKGSGQDA